MLDKETPLKPAGSLSKQRQLFVAEYLKDLNATQAAIRAGYSRKTARIQASKMLTNPNISAAIEAAFERRIERAEVDADWVLHQAVLLYERCMQAEPVRDQEGNPTGEWKFDSAGAARALKIIGDHVDISAFKATDEDGKPIDLNWKVTVVHTGSEKLIPVDP
jgi:phage terminase small subunit